jgi:membrane-bound inhibitor of C-type lysozyme
LTVSFYNETDPRIAVLEIDGATMVTFAALSASGARYASGGVGFWEHHGEATLKRPASTLTCTLRK